MKIGNDSLNAQVPNGQPQPMPQPRSPEPAPRAAPAQERLELNLAHLSYKALKTRL